MGEARTSARDTWLDRIRSYQGSSDACTHRMRAPQDWPTDMDYNPRHARCFFWARLIHARFSQIRLEAREIGAAARRAWFVGENAYGKF